MNRESNITLLTVLFCGQEPLPDTEVLSLLSEQSDRILLIREGGSSFSGDNQNFIQWERKGVQRGVLFKEVLQWAKENEFSHFLTLELLDLAFVSGIPTLQSLSHTEPESIIVASRSRRGNPLSKLVTYFWRYMHNIWIRVYTGMKMSDAASTLRVYPIAQISELELTAKGFEVEQEVLLKAAWNKIRISDVIVHEEKIETCKKRRGFFYSVRLLFLWLKAFFHRFLSPFSGAPIPGNGFRQKVKNLVIHELRSNISANKAAFSLAMGVYFGLLPIHGFQIVSLLFVTTKFRLNRPLAFLGVNISMPPLLPFVLYFSLKAGSFLTGSHLDVQLGDRALLEQSLTYGVDFIVGGFVLAHGVALLVYLLLYPLFTLIKKDASK